MSKLHVNYPDLKDHPELTSADVDVLHKFEREVQKALPVLFCKMVNATWVYLPGLSDKYFRLEAHTKPRLPIGEFGLSPLKRMSREAFYHKLQALSFRTPDVKK